MAAPKAGVTKVGEVEKTKLVDILDGLFNQSRDLEAEIKKQLAGLKYE